MKFGSPGCWKMHFRACKSFACSGSGFFVVETKSFMESFMNFIGSLLPFTSCRKVLRKISDGRVLHLVKLQAFSKVAT